MCSFRLKGRVSLPEITIWAAKAVILAQKNEYSEYSGMGPVMVTLVARFSQTRTGRMKSIMSVMDPGLPSGHSH